MGNAGQDPTYRQVEQKIIEPLLDFRHQVQPLNQIHNDCIQQFTTMMMGLLTGSDGETAMQGPGSNALAELIGNFLDGEQQLSGTDPSTLEGRLQDAAVICERHAHNLQTTINSFPTSRRNGNPSLFATISGILDDGDGPEDEGPDDPDDIAIGDLMQYQSDMQGPITEPLSKLPDINDMPETNTGPTTQPLTPLPGDNTGFLKSLGILGITAGGAAVLAAGAIVIVNLTSEEEDLAQRLYVDYGSSGLSLDDIRAIIGANPNLTEAQLRELLNQYGKVIAANPNLVGKYGALAVFEEFIALAAYDASHGGNYSIKRPVQNMPNLQGGIEEAEAEMGAMENGEVPWPLTPSADPHYDATDPTGQKWDEKSYRSVDTNGKPYNAQNTVQKLQKDIGQGEKIIFDDSQLTQSEIDDTYNELKAKNQENDVVWWPTKPTQLSSPPATP